MMNSVSITKESNHSAIINCIRQKRNTEGEICLYSQINRKRSTMIGLIIHSFNIENGYMANFEQEYTLSDNSVSKIDQKIASFRSDSS